MIFNKSLTTVSMYTNCVQTRTFFWLVRELFATLFQSIMFAMVNKTSGKPILAIKVTYTKQSKQDFGMITLRTSGGNAIQIAQTIKQATTTGPVRKEHLEIVCTSSISWIVLAVLPRESVLTTIAYSLCVYTEEN